MGAATGTAVPTRERIVEAARAATGKTIYMVVGGLHLLPAKDDEIQRIAGALRDRWEVEWIAPGHCTGEPAFEILQRTFRDHYVYAGLGAIIPFARDRHTAYARPPAI